MYCYKVNAHLLARCAPLIRRLQRNSSVPASNKNELVDTDIKYPPILDLSRPARKRREREEWHTKVKKLGTVEEKIFELNMPRYYGWKVLKLREGFIPYDPLPKAQFLTKTHIVEEPKLPSFYDNLLTAEEIDASVQQMKNQIEDALVFEYNYKKQDHQFTKDELEDPILMDNLISKSVSQQIHRILTTNLAVNYTHLLEAQMDIEPRNEAFWFFGGLETPYEIVRSRKGHWAKEWSDEPINQCIQYYGNPVLQVRHNLPLKEIMPLKDSENSSLEIPVEPLDPRKVGYILDRTRATIVPGFWPGDQNEFGLISYHNRGYLTRRPEQFNDNLDAIKTQAVLGSFSWLYSQACYQGFSTFQDPTYPFVNQMIITNGQWWTFCVYQLNTITMHMDVINENPRRNICWITEPMKLFDSIENGTIQGFNDDVLKHLIKFYINTPEAKEGVEMQPYLSNEKVIAGIEEDERRKWLEYRYKYLVSNRSRHRLIPEIYDWQKIYMINHNTRFVDKKRDPWQFGINVYKRRLDDHTPEYIPKVCRPYPRSKKKWATNYYPEVRENKNSSS